MGLVFGGKTARDYYRLAAIGVVPMPTPHSGTSLSDHPRLSDLPVTHVFRRKGFTVGELKQRGVYPVPDWLHVRKHITKGEVQEIVSHFEQVEEFAYLAPRPLDVLVRSKSARAQNKTMRQHVLGCPLPPGSLRAVGTCARANVMGAEGEKTCPADGTDPDAEVCVPSPELLYLLAAQSLRDEHLIAAYGCELTGAYSLLPRGLVNLGKVLANKEEGEPIGLRDLLAADGYVTRQPLTTCARINAFLDQIAPHTPGLRAARHALRWVKDGSRSPMETVSSLSLRMSGSCGGFGVGNGEFNVRLEISKKWQDVLGKPYVVVDELFQSPRHKNVIAEYNGAGGHLSMQQSSSDNLRRGALIEAGHRVFFITAPDFLDYDKWTALAHSIVSALGKHPRENEKVIARRRKVHADFCNPNLLK